MTEHTAARALRLRRRIDAVEETASTVLALLLPALLSILLVLAVGVDAATAAGPVPAAATAEPSASAAPETAAPSAPPAAPRGFSVTRDPDSPLDLLLTWRPPRDDAAVAWYDVTIVSRGRAQVVVVPADQGSYRVRGGASSETATWRVRVGSRDVTGEGGDVGWVIVWPATPSAPTSLAGGRGQADRTRVEVTWEAPRRAGYGPVEGYRVELVRLKDRSSQVVQTQGTRAVFDGADVGDTQVVKVTALTALGSSSEARLMIRNRQPARPRGFVAVRSPEQPKTVVMSWEEPSYTGFGPVTGYRIGWRRPGGRFYWDLELPGSARSATVEQHVAERRYWSLRAVNDRAVSFRVRDVLVGRTSDAPDPVVVPQVTPIVVSTSGRTVHVQLGDAVPSSATRVRMSLAPQADTVFRDTAEAPGDSRAMEIGDVPDGLYLVTVTADLASGPQVLHTASVRVGAAG